ncbi:MAG: FAD-dependent oxidoreductase, partial [Pseudomonadota bacterium]
MTERLVMIGAGMAAGRLLEHLVAEDAPYDITLINGEPRGTYNRLALSPVLAGEKAFEDIITHDADWYRRAGIATRFGERVTHIDRDARVVTAPGGSVAYDRLVIATGSTPFIIPLPGHDLEGVISYRDVEDTARMMGLPRGARAVVIGGGLLGLEAAAGMAARGVEVTVVHIMDHLMERQLDVEAAGLLRASLEGKGIRVLCNAQSEAILGEKGHVIGLKLKDGTVLPCDLLCMAVGIRPATALAKETGLDVEKGIIVDDTLATSDPHIFALGECVEHRGALFGLVAPLYDQARVLADTLLGRPAQFVQKSLSTKLKVTGCDLFSAGDFAEGAGRETVLYRSDDGYKKLVISDDRLIGAVMYGETEDGLRLFDLIEAGKPLGDARDTLLFGDFGPAAPLPRCS